MACDCRPPAAGVAAQKNHGLHRLRLVEDRHRSLWGSLVRGVEKIQLVFELRAGLKDFAAERALRLLER